MKKWFLVGFLGTSLCCSSKAQLVVRPSNIDSQPYTWLFGGSLDVKATGSGQLRLTYKGLEHYSAGGALLDTFRFEDGGWVSGGSVTAPSFTTTIGGGPITTYSASGISQDDGGSGSEFSINPDPSGILYLGTENTALTKVGTVGERVSLNGNVGIGTTDPQATLHVKDGPVKVANAGNGTLVDVLQFNIPALPTRYTNSVQSSSSGNVTSGANALSFMLNNDASGYTQAEAFKIADNGVTASSAGAATPILNVFSTSTSQRGWYQANGPYVNTSGDNGGNLYTTWGTHFNGTTNTWVRDYTGGLPSTGYSINTDGDWFVMSDTATSGVPSYTKRLVVSNAGAVGIGVTYPSAYKLEVAGSVKHGHVYGNTDTRGTAVIDTVTYVDVTFATAWASTPNVIVCPTSDLTNANADPGNTFYVSNQSTTGFRINVQSNFSQSNMSFNWQAQG